MNTVLSTSLCQGIKDWFNGNSYFVDIFDNISVLFKQIDDYYRIDVAQGGFTSVCIYPIISDTEKSPQKESGKIGINISFSGNINRESRGLFIYSTISAVRAQMLSNPVYLQTFLSNKYVPGLQLINGQNRTDYTKLNRQIFDKSPTITALVELNYTIDIYLNQKALWLNGNDFYSPVTKIYDIIDGVDISLNTVNKTELMGYLVTPSSGYTTTGVAIQPSVYAGKSLLLGNNGIVSQPVLFDPLPSTISLQYLYIDTISALYPSTGMLILSSNAITGNAGILLGDNGTVYNIVYDGTVCNTLFYATNQVLQSTAYPINGILLTRIDVSVGNAGILFGSDGNIYNVQYSLN